MSVRAESRSERGARPRRSCAPRIVRSLALVALFALLPSAASHAVPPSHRVDEIPPRRVAVLPLENLSGVAAPLRDLEALVEREMRLRGFQPVDPDTLYRFMARYRMRWTGGVATELAQAMERELGAQGVLITTLESYQERTPFPRIALTSRLVRTGDDPEIVWMSGLSRVGDESPGALDLKLIEEMDDLARVVVHDLFEDLSFRFGGDRIQWPREAKSRFRPDGLYVSPDWNPVTERPVRVAVLPFNNDTLRREAGQIVSLQVVRHLVGRPEIDLIEPGVVRQTLLQSRLIPSEGVSYPQADILKVLLGADVVILGDVLDYEDGASGGVPPVVEFTVRGIDTNARQVAWVATTYQRGNQRVWFFDAGRIVTAHELGSWMTLGIVDRLLALRDER